MEKINKSIKEQKKAWVSPELLSLDVNETNDPLKDPGTSEGAFQQMS